MTNQRFPHRYSIYNCSFEAWYQPVARNHFEKSWLTCSITSNLDKRHCAGFLQFRWPVSHVKLVGYITFCSLLCIVYAANTPGSWNGTFNGVMYAALASSALPRHWKPYQKMTTILHAGVQQHICDCVQRALLCRTDYIHRGGSLTSVFCVRSPIQYETSFLRCSFLRNFFLCENLNTSTLTKVATAYSLRASLPNSSSKMYMPHASQLRLYLQICESQTFGVRNARYHKKSAPSHALKGDHSIIVTDVGRVTAIPMQTSSQPDERSGVDGVPRAWIQHCSTYHVNNHWNVHALHNKHCLQSISHKICWYNRCMDEKNRLV